MSLFSISSKKASKNLDYVFRNYKDLSHINYSNEMLYTKIPNHFHHYTMVVHGPYIIVHISIDYQYDIIGWGMAMPTSVVWNLLLLNDWISNGGFPTYLCKLPRASFYLCNWYDNTSRGQQSQACCYTVNMQVMWSKLTDYQWDNNTIPYNESVYRYQQMENSVK